MLQGILRTLRRVGIRTNFSQGFNPSPKISFGPALPAGTESLAEFFIMDLPHPLKSCATALGQLNDKLVPGLKITKIEAHSGKVPQSLEISYNLLFPREITDKEKAEIARFQESATYAVAKTRKGKTSEIDIRPLISHLTIANPAEISLIMASVSAQPGIKPIEAVEQILGLDKEEILKIKILKTSWRNLDSL
jgi:radical SAM-linked protein